MRILPTKTINKCRLCDSGRLELILDYGLMPMAGGFAPKGDPRLEDRAPLRLGLCESCGLMQTLDSVDPDSLFNEYSYQSSASPSLRKHFQLLAGRINRLMKVGAQDPGHRVTAVDIGCNDGVLLAEFDSVGWKTVGIDPSDVAKRASERHGWRLVNDYASRAAINRERLAGQADIVTACNVLAHTDDIHGMLDAVDALLSEDGIFVIEVQYQLDLLQKVQFDTVYHEHCSYFSLSNLSRLLGEHGMKVWFSERIPTHSGSIRVLASRNRRTEKMLSPDGEMYGPSGWDAVSPKEFARRALRAKKRIEQTFDMFRDSELGDCSGIVTYGAAGRATILLNWCGLGWREIDAVLDASPLRVGKVVPGVEIPILSTGVLDRASPGKVLPQVVLVTAWNYADSIMSQHPDYPGLWMLPLPEVRLI